MTAVRVVEEMDEAAVVAEVCRSVADMIEIEEAVDEVEIVRSMSSRDMRLLLRARGADLLAEPGGLAAAPREPLA